MASYVFLDLDRTLFDTARFMDAIWGEIARRYNLDQQDELAKTPHWYRSMGDYRYYDLRMHIQEGLCRDADDVIAAVFPALAKHTFIYPDVTAVMALQKKHPDYNFRVLTFGPVWVQQLKMRLAPAIAGLPCDMILEAKGEFIAKNFAGAYGLLVDDRRNAGLPPGIKEVWLQREPETQGDNKNVTIIQSLAQIGDLL